MTSPLLRPHQRQAVEAVLRTLELPAQAHVPELGLRTQVVMATGSGKTLVAVRSAEELQAGRVLVLVPSLDLLTQTEAAWREGRRSGPGCRPCVGVRRGSRTPRTWTSWSRGCGRSTR
ncbi:DEAD/DEAH box helicase family protein [Streptomyces sp. NPDC003697]